MRMLVLCTGNSCRSQMAEGFLRAYLPAEAVVKSAGTRPHAVHPLAIEVMKEVDIDLSTHRSKSVDEFTGQTFDYVLTVCDNAQENCPYFPAQIERLHHDFSDPATATGTHERQLHLFRTVRDEIAGYCKALAARIR